MKILSSGNQLRWAELHLICLIFFRFVLFHISYFLVVDLYLVYYLCWEQGSRITTVDTYGIRNIAPLIFLRKYFFTNIYPNIYPKIFLFQIFLSYIMLNKEHAIAPPQCQCKWKYSPWLEIRLCKLCDKRFCVKMRTKIYIFSCTSDIKKHFKTLYIYR